MKKKRLLMTPENARKCHDGTKTVTRRVIVPPPKHGIDCSVIRAGWKPRYQVGDIVAIAERHWRYGAFKAPERRRFWTMDDEMHPILFMPPSEPPPTKDTVFYHKRPGLFLPYDHARTYWEITSVNAERLHAITAADCIAEGIAPLGPEGDGDVFYMEAFAELWDSVNAARGFPWPGNWPVWRYEGKKVTV